jgi:branched-chain amino acid transport system ATP-binding protein
MSVFENLQMGAAVNASLAHFDEEPRKGLHAVPALKERLQQRGGTLSGGEQQMLAIARALMSRPKPAAARRALAGSRPADRQADLRGDPRAQQAEGLTVFLVEQNAFHALKLAHRGYVMVNGLITMSGTGQELLSFTTTRPMAKASPMRPRRR